MDTPPPEDHPISDPSWEKWRNEQVETISNILSNVFKVEDAARQTKTPSRLTVMPGKSEKEIREKLKLIREQLSEYDQMVQLGLKRIDNALQIIQPPKPEPEKIIVPPPTNRLKKWFQKIFK